MLHTFLMPLQTMLHLLLLMLGVVFATPAAATGKDWRLVKDKDGILVYTSDAANSALKSIKVTAEFDGTTEKFWAILQDIDRQPAWVYGTKRAYLVRRTGPNELLYYTETEVPWPASNRDAVIRMKMTQNKAARSLELREEGVPRALPATKNTVRVPHLEARWQVTQVGSRKIRLEYYLDLDPGGAIPAWVLRLFISKGPYETFARLRELLKE